MTHFHELLVAEPHISIAVIVSPVSQMSCRCTMPNKQITTYFWKASVRVFITTHALTNRSNVIPGGGPWPPVGADATGCYNQQNMVINEQQLIHNTSAQSSLKGKAIDCIRSCARLRTTLGLRWYQTGLYQNA